MSKWISVKERLPEKEKQVIIFIPSNRHINRHRQFMARLCEFNECEVWHIIDCVTNDDAQADPKFVSHWIPLPSPPNCDHTGDCLEDPEEYFKFENLDELKKSIQQDAEEVWSIIKAQDDEIKKINEKLSPILDSEENTFTVNHISKITDDLERRILDIQRSKVDKEDYETTLKYHKSFIEGMLMGISSRIERLEKK